VCCGSASPGGQRGGNNGLTDNGAKAFAFAIQNRLEECTLQDVFKGNSHNNKGMHFNGVNFEYNAELLELTKYYMHTPYIS
jgi:hypothetical protein